ncbi:sodium channel protein Nach-like [Schistocerca serialis cubense]|uniref:sodium channel protein Nach-like n=1 Tax=Schistocerca serialis cubense TaxID=2023355 RepID=UPI00214F46AD|nr:sodium channel protein Nach-like [Schistocerca serialis cubense]
MIFRVSDISIPWLKEYLANSSINGLRYLSGGQYHWTERVFWFIAVTVSCYYTVIFTLASFHAYKMHAVSFTTETDYLHWNTKFPAFSVCEITGVNDVKFGALASKRWTAAVSTSSGKRVDHAQGQQVAGNGMDSCDSGAVKFTGKINYNQIDYWENIAFYQGSIIEHKKCSGDVNCSTNYEEIIWEFRYRCNKLLYDCHWNGKPFDCCQNFLPLQTEVGPCFSINSENTRKKNGLLKTVSNYTTGPGSLYFKVRAAVKVYMHSEGNVPTNSHSLDEMFKVFYPQYLEVLFTVKEVVNDPMLYEVEPSGRDCLFRNEVPTGVYPYYSFTTCLVQCHKQHHLKFCNCTHHMMPNSADEVCGIEGLACLNGYNERLGILKAAWETKKLGIVCDCRTSCDDQEYNVVWKHATTKRGGSTNYESFVSEISLKMHSLPVERFKRNVVRTKLDLVVSIGGTAGFFLGASLLSVVEFVMYFFVRSIYHCVNINDSNANKNHRMKVISHVTEFAKPFSNNFKQQIRYPSPWDFQK